MLIRIGIVQQLQGSLRGEHRPPRQQGVQFQDVFLPYFNILQDDVLELNALLSRWPVLPAERALQLLDYAYPDEHVRKFAVK